MRDSSDSGKGGGWVVAQFALMGAVIAAGFVGDWPGDVERALNAIGTILAVAGGLFALWSARALGGALTWYPKPRGGGELVADGPYRFSRHPIYSGGIAFFVGWGLYSSPAALVLAVALGFLWAFKARVEERLLAERYPGYAEYRRRTRWRLLPGVY